MKNAPNPAAQLGIVIAVAITGATLAGVWLDKRLETGFICTIGGLVLAMIFVVYELWKLNRSVYKDQENDDENDESPEN